MVEAGRAATPYRPAMMTRMGPMSGDRRQQSAPLMARRLRAALRKARAGAGLTQAQVAESLDWSLSKVVRIELGAVPVTSTDVRAMLTCYGNQDPEATNRLVELARQYRIHSDRQRQDTPSPYSKAAQELFATEGDATAIYKYEPTFVPGLFQTFDYAQAILRALGHSTETVRKMISIRLDRQQLLEDENRPQLHIIMGEASLSRPVGGQKTMLDQIDVLRRYSAMPGIEFRLLPFSAGPSRAMSTAFTVLQFDEPELGDLMYLEGPRSETLIREDAELAELIEDYLQQYVELQNMADSAGPFLTLVDELVSYRYPSSIETSE